MNRHRRCGAPSGPGASMWTLDSDQPVIPGVPFIPLDIQQWAMALPFRTTGSLCPAFAPAWLVGLAVRSCIRPALRASSNPRPSSGMAILAIAIRPRAQ